MELKPGMKALMMVDSTNDPLVQDAFQIAVEEAGGKLEKIMLRGYPELKEPVELVDTMFSRNWWPDWVWQAIKDADILLQGAFLHRAYSPRASTDVRNKTRLVSLAWPADTLASSYETFPIELRDAIDKKTWELLGYAKEIIWTDAEGTELKVSFSREEWEKLVQRDLKNEGVPYKRCHLGIPAPSLKLEGTLVFSSVSFGGPVPKTILTVKGGQAIKVDGGGKCGEVLRRSFEEYKNLHYPGFPGPGINWVMGFGIHTNPKSIRSPFWDTYTGSGRMFAWGFGHRRSGALHIPIGQGQVTPEYRAVRHVTQYFPTIIADGRKVIEYGHLLALDAPEVIKEAGKYGDPKRLLAEEWVPAISGVNAP